MLACASSALALLVQPQSGHTTTYPEGYDWHAEDPLIYGHIVVEGVIKEVHFKEVTREQLFYSDPADPRKPWVGVLGLEEVKVLRGGQLKLPVEVKLLFDWREAVGRRVILCARWWPRLDSYYVHDEKGVFFSSGADWIRMEPEETVSDIELRARLAEVQPAVVARKADIVAIGTITSLEDSTITGDPKYGRALRKVTLEPVEVIEGEARQRLSFYVNNWVMKIPRLKVGQRWMVFLETTSGIPYVAAGANAMFTVADDGRLLYDGIAPSSLSKAEFLRLIREEKSDGN